MKVNVKLLVQYDGTDFNGWQIQSGQPGSRTVQNVLRQAVETIVKEPVTLLGAGRTDAGVHARGQVASFVTSRPIPEDRWQPALNSILPYDIRIISAQEAGPEFHPQYDAKKKMYCYYIWNSPYPDVFLRRYSLHCSRHLDLERMKQAAASLVGTMDFQAFCSSGSSVKNYVRTVYQAEFVPLDNIVQAHFAGDSCGNPAGVSKGETPEDLLEGKILVFRISANGFLYKMVRSIVGTLLEVGSGKYPPQWVEEVLRSKDRGTAGPTAPSHGLFLEKVWYR